MGFLSSFLITSNSKSAMWSSFVVLVPTLCNPVGIYCTVVNYMSQAELYFRLIVRALLEWTLMDYGGMQGILTRQDSQRNAP